jgi:AraC-like DNA-binding protein
MFYVLLLVILWVKNFYGDENSIFRRENKYLAQWTFVLSLLLLIGITPSLIVFLFKINLDLATLLNSSLYFITICFALFLFFRPEIIYGVKGIWVFEEPQPVKPVEPVKQEEEATPVEHSEVPKKIYLREDVVEMIGKRIETYLNEEQPFLTSGFSISDLSAAVGHPVHQISAYLNNHLGMNFNEYINAYRINYLLEKINEDPSWRKYTLEALGQKVGFSNRYTFLNAFKKVTGETPSTYLKIRKSTEA